MGSQIDRLRKENEELRRQLSTVVEQMQRQVAEMGQRHEQQLATLNEYIRLLLTRQYGRSTEQAVALMAGQLQLFEPSTPPATAEEAPTEQPVEVVAHKRRSTGRKPLPADLPSCEVLLDIPEELKQCACGSPKCRIGEERTSQLDFIPAYARNLVLVRPKYACRACEGVDGTGPTVSIAPLPPQLLPRSGATPNLVAHIVVQKFCDALPLYRQESLFTRLGVALTRAKMCDWLLKVAEKLKPLVLELEAEARAGPLIAIDETTLKVLDQPGRSANAKSFVWVFCGGTPARRVVCFKYTPTRHGVTARDFLTGYSGAVVSDGFSGYNALDKTSSIVHLGCWAHARRKFADVIKAMGKGSTSLGVSHEAVARIRGLYAIERRAKDENLTPDQIRALRQREAKPILEAMHTWLNQKSGEAAPSSLLGKAIRYTLGQWDRLVLYIDDGHYRIDNNPAENAIRPFVVGRKNWLFCETEKGAHASATYYSLIETAKANDLEPAAYLRFLLNRLPYATTAAEKRALLPTRVTREMLTAFEAGGVR